MFTSHAGLTLNVKAASVLEENIGRQLDDPEMKRASFTGYTDG